MKPFWDLMDSTYSQARVPSPDTNVPADGDALADDGTGDVSSSDVEDGYDVDHEEHVSPECPQTEEEPEPYPEVPDTLPEVPDTFPDTPPATEIPDSQPQDEETWKLYFGSCAVCGKSGPHECADTDVGPSKQEVSQEMDHMRTDLLEKIKKIQWGVEKSLFTL